MVLSLALDGLLTCLSWSFLHLINTDPYSRVTLCASLELLHTSLLSGTQSCQFLQFWPQTLSSVSSSGESTRCCINSSLYCGLETLKSVCWVNCKAHFIFLISFWNYFPSLPHVQCFEKHWFIYIFGFSIIPGEKSQLLHISWIQKSPLIHFWLTKTCPDFLWQTIGTFVHSSWTERFAKSCPHKFPLTYKWQCNLSLTETPTCI